MASDAAGDRGDLPTRDDSDLLAALRTGDEAAFTVLVERYHMVMVRLARTYVRDTGLAEEVAQDAWLSILRGLDGFEARSSLKTWIFRIVINRALARASREQRVIPFSDAGNSPTEDAGAAVEPGRFRGPEDPWHGGWVSFPPSWGPSPEQRLLSGEVRQFIHEAIHQLPPGQREVVMLRDVQGWDAAEVCHTLELSEVNQRVLLHRGRSKLRRALAHYLAGE
jgi:RNA polymerase sigma-70 factor (ECF subfamily)